MSILDEIAAAMTELRQAEEVADAKRTAVHALIAAASADPQIKQVEIQRATDYSRETLRKIARAAEVGS